MNLAAKLGLLLVQGDPMAARRGGRRRGETGRSGSDHRDAFGLVRRLIEFGLPARARIDETGRGAVGKDEIEAGLVAGDAGIDVFGPALLRLEHEIRIGQHRPRHRHEIAGAVGALAGSIQMTAGAASSGLVAALFDGRTALSMTTVMAACSLLALIAYGLLARRAERRSHAQA